jgi:type II secretory pathway pseudopilin PulG
VLLTLTLIAVLAAIVVPAYFARYDVTLDNASVLVAHELRAAQSWAAAHAHDVTFQFAANGDGFRVLDADGLVIERNDPRGPFERRFSSDGVFEGVRFEAIDFEPAQAVRFDERGHAQNGGSVAITFQDERRVLRLTPGTGRITLEGLGRAWRDDELR